MQRWPRSDNSRYGKARDSPLQSQQYVRRQGIGYKTKQGLSIPYEIPAPVEVISLQSPVIRFVFALPCQMR